MSQSLRELRADDQRLKKFYLIERIHVDYGDKIDRINRRRVLRAISTRKIVTLAFRVIREYALDDKVPPSVRWILLQHCTLRYSLYTFFPLFFHDILITKISSQLSKNSVERSPRN